MKPLFVLVIFHHLAAGRTPLLFRLEALTGMLECCQPIPYDTYTFLTFAIHDI